MSGLAAFLSSFVRAHERYCRAALLIDVRGHAFVGCFKLPRQAVLVGFERRSRNRKSTIFPSCRWSQSSLVVGIGPTFKRSMFVASAPCLARRRSASTDRLGAADTGAEPIL